MVGNVDRNNGCYVVLLILRSHHMKRTFALEPQDQATWLRHFCRVIFNNFPGLKRLGDLLRGDITLKHTLNGMDAEKDSRIVH